MVNIIDPSDKFRPEKPEEQFRNYTEDCAYIDRVKKTYYTMHTNQSYNFAKSKVTFQMLSILILILAFHNFDIRLIICDTNYFCNPCLHGEKVVLICPLKQFCMFNNLCIHHTLGCF